MRQIQGEIHKTAIEKIDDFLVSQMKPQNFAGAKGFEVQYIAAFEEACSVIAQHSHRGEPKKLTTLAFHHELALLKDKYKKQESGR